MFKPKNHQASILAATLIIMSIMLASAIAVLSAAVRDRRISMDASHSVTAFQTAEQGIEQVISGMMNSKIGDTVYKLSNGADKLISGASCDSSTGKITLGNNTIEFLNDSSTPPYNIACSNNGIKISKIKEIKVSGTDQQNARAIQASSPCFGADPNDTVPVLPAEKTLVGWWKMDSTIGGGVRDEVHDADSNYYLELKTKANSTENCPVSAVPPSFGLKPNTGPNQKQALIFANLNSNRCQYALIKNKVSTATETGYDLDTGSVSMWVWREDDSWDGSNKWPIFMKDDYECDVDYQNGTEDCNSANGSPECDCGHLQFNFLGGISPKLSALFQNDGDWGGSELSKSGTTLSGEDWHLMTLNFNHDRYQLFLDGKLNSEIWKKHGGGSCGSTLCDEDEEFEGLVHNKNDIYLGRTAYPTPEAFGGNVTSRDSDDAINRKYLNGALSDLRIYKRTLTKCEINQMYNTYK